MARRPAPLGWRSSSVRVRRRYERSHRCGPRALVVRLGAVRIIAQPAEHRVRPALDAVAATASRDDDAPATNFVVAHLRRTPSLYPAGTMLVWRDAGAILAGLQLAATAARLASCI